MDRAYLERSDQMNEHFFGLRAAQRVDEKTAQELLEEIDEADSYEEVEGLLRAIQEMKFIGQRWMENQAENEQIYANATIGRSFWVRVVNKTDDKHHNRVFEMRSDFAALNLPPNDIFLNEYTRYDMDRKLNASKIGLIAERMGFGMHYVQEMESGRIGNEA